MSQEVLKAPSMEARYLLFIERTVTIIDTLQNLLCPGQEYGFLPLGHHPLVELDIGEYPGDDGDLLRSGQIQVPEGYITFSIDLLVLLLLALPG